MILISFTFCKSSTQFWCLLCSSVIHKRANFNLAFFSFAIQILFPSMFLTYFKFQLFQSHACSWFRMYLFCGNVSEPFFNECTFSILRTGQLSIFYKLDHTMMTQCVCTRQKTWKIIASFFIRFKIYGTINWIINLLVHFEFLCLKYSKLMDKIVRSSLGSNDDITCSKVSKTDNSVREIGWWTYLSLFSTFKIIIW